MFIRNVISASRHLNNLVNTGKELAYLVEEILVYKPYKYHRKCIHTNFKSGPWRVLFFGTDDFALESLKKLHHKWMDKSLEHLEVVTMYKDKDNAVTKYAKQNGIVINPWPPEVNIKDFHIGVVVSFGKLIPSCIIDSFPLGMLNVHGSLLPRWRGAAPIIYALMNGDTHTGITIMRIMPKKFDIGDIVKQRRIDISPHETLPELFSRLKKVGAELLMETLEELPDVLATAIPQSETGVTYAPKVTQKISLIKWDEMDAESIYNLQRALTGLYPLTTHFQNVSIKLIDIKRLENTSSTFKELQKPGCVKYDKKNQVLVVSCKGESYIVVKKIIVPGKPAMNAHDFNNGFIAGRGLSMLFFES